MEQVRLRCYLAEKRTYDNAKLAANEIAVKAIEILKAMKIVE
jgi:hypothetical protein